MRTAFVACLLVATVRAHAVAQEEPPLAECTTSARDYLAVVGLEALDPPLAQEVRRATAELGLPLCPVRADAPPLALLVVERAPRETVELAVVDAEIAVVARRSVSLDGLDPDARGLALSIAVGELVQGSEALLREARAEALARSLRSRPAVASDDAAEAESSQDRAPEASAEELPRPSRVAFLGGAAANVFPGAPFDLAGTLGVRFAPGAVGLRADVGAGGALRTGASDLQRRFAWLGVGADWRWLEGPRWRFSGELLLHAAWHRFRLTRRASAPGLRAQAQAVVEVGHTLRLRLGAGAVARVVAARAEDQDGTLPLDDGARVGLAITVGLAGAWSGRP